jgi:hypothetical protein
MDRSTQSNPVMICLALALLVIALSPFVITVWPQENPRIVEAVEKTRCPDVLQQVYEKMYKGASRETIDRLKTSSHTGIALRAAWEIVLRDGMTADLRGKPPMLAVDSSTMQRFLGFVEGRLRVTPPRWWMSELATAKYGWLHGPTVWPEDLKSLREKLCSTTKALIHAPHGASVERVGGGLRIVLKSDEALSVSKSLLKEVEDEQSFDPEFGGDGKDSIDVVVVDSERFIVAFYRNTTDEQYPLYCISRLSGKIVWKANVWEAAPSMAGSIEDFFVHVAAIRIAGDMVYVFGMTSASAYVDAFSLIDGKNRFHFSTSY